jgi:hypothetical protein
MNVRKGAIAMAIAIGVVGLSPVAALAGKPGPGDKQCIPGQQGNPKPGHKAGVCPNPGK